MCKEVCYFKNEDCESVGCKGTREEWMDSDKCQEVSIDDCIADLTKACSICSKGILSPTFDGKLACDKCTYIEDIDNL